ncbi:D-isomer specific 2-hydroxyacid dehydrogenase NAD-binding [Penicillium citrinum]|uniref:D-isomer specific 2-hydroxyacid dehydrogenase NAD-binding n=1 Tax=Penicillium citrinum TaxID=5077 RepID=A0A9W9THJ6_PENCI|nr:D-isomer specific 2-hydroxyacid dehydrogenase NAD-binding [Penicillium citrinum]KAJ5222933.1 D-isomer specific 2-hydroxyacid dehydrogenase NAD-binding [Penicillium citrinum]
MGSVGVPRERVLVIYGSLSPEVEDSIRETFADQELTIYQPKPGEVTPPELYRKATILATFSHLPKPEDAQNLKIIHSFSAGLDHLINNPILKEGKIAITSSSGIHGPPIAEWTIMNWIIASRKHFQIYEAQKAHRWDDKDQYLRGNHDQAGKKVGILGYGSIGRQIGRVSQALGMSVYAYTASPRKTPESKRDNGYIVPGTGDADGSIPVSWHHGLDQESLHSFLSLGLDHLVISLPLTPQTTKFLGAEEFALLSASSTSKAAKPYITNISRGKVLDQDALIEALNAGHLSGAALDVTDPEPLPEDHPLWDTPNVQISPHLSGIGREYLPRSLDILRINLGRLARGEPLINAYGGKGY